MTEVQLGELAMRNSKNEKVHRFADQMIKDHGKANQELLGIAEQKNIIVGKKLDPKHHEIVQKLSSKTDPQFDAEYAQHMVTDHKQAVALFQRATQMKDPALAEYAKQTLPTLEEHKKMADDLNSSLRTASANQGSEPKRQ